MQVPASWVNLAYPSLRPLGSWLLNLLQRVTQLAEWTADLGVPKSVWLSGLFNPQSFLTAVMQVGCAAATCTCPPAMQASTAAAAVAPLLVLGRGTGLPLLQLGGMMLPILQVGCQRLLFMCMLRPLPCTSWLPVPSHPPPCSSCRQLLAAMTGRWTRQWC